jgi:hypothetical protein
VGTAGGREVNVIVCAAALTAKPDGALVEVA